jgi:hypothetical protein
MGRPRDHLAEERLRAGIERDLLQLQAQAVKHQLEIMQDPRYDAEKWSDRTVKTGASAKWVEVAAAEVRARKEAEGPRVFGMVLIQPKIEDKKSWEKFAVDGGRPAIEAVSSIRTPGPENVTPPPFVLPSDPDDGPEAA